MTDWKGRTMGKALGASASVTVWEEPTSSRMPPVLNAGDTIAIETSDQSTIPAQVVEVQDTVVTIQDASGQAWDMTPHESTDPPVAVKQNNIPSGTWVIREAQSDDL